MYEKKVSDYTLIHVHVVKIYVPFSRSVLFFEITYSGSKI